MSANTIDPPDDPDDPDDGPGPNPDDGNRSGRPTKLTGELAEAFCALLISGCFRSVACRTLNLHPRTLRRWLKAGAKYPTGIYGNFARAVVSAEAEAEAKAVAEVLAAGRGDPKYLCWWLERKFPHRWGRDRADLMKLKRDIADLTKEVRSMEEKDGGLGATAAAD